MAGGDHEAPILGAVRVSERQKALIDLALSGVRDLDAIASRLGLTRQDLMRDVEELRARGLLEVIRREERVLSLTDEGRRYLSLGLPEERVARVLEALEEVPIGEISRKAAEVGVELTDAEAKIGMQHLLRRGAAAVSRGALRVTSAEALRRALGEFARLREALRAVAEGRAVPDDVEKALSRRRLIEVRRRRKLELSPTELARSLVSKGLLIGVRVITALTPEIIETGAWRGAVFKEYDLKVEPPTLYPGRKHPYFQLLDEVREILVSMGFEEMKGPHVELELWNFDALFQAQDHPAREIHDTYFLKYPKYGECPDKELMERIARTHEDGWITGSKGWGYKWDPRRALRLILRTQTTAVSMRTIYGRGEGEYRCFSLDRVFRPETLDAKHSMEFYQLEGIIVGRRVTFRHLLGFFQEVAKRLGLGKVKVKPAYFPFTEPSVEGFIKHPKLGWIEVFPGGMFRPEVLMPLGVRNCNVAAWGIGIDRIAMAILGIDDIRLLFTQDLQFLRNSKVPVIGSLVR